MKTFVAKIVAAGGCLTLVFLAAGCQSHVPVNVSELPATTHPAAAVPDTSCQYLVSGGIIHPGPRTLKQGETISMVLLANLPNPPGKPITIVLMRHAPEGKTRQLIDVDANGKLMDEKQDVAIRDGDEISFPGGAEPKGGANPADR